MLTVCGTEEVYWDRVLGANPFHFLSVEVEELSRQNGGEFVAEFRGDIIQGKPSTGPAYYVDGTLIVSEIISVRRGDERAAGRSRRKRAIQKERLQTGGCRQGGAQIGKLVRRSAIGNSGRLLPLNLVIIGCRVKLDTGAERAPHWR